jgi:hypothetical protein
MQRNSAGKCCGTRNLLVPAAATVFNVLGLAVVLSAAAAAAVVVIVLVLSAIIATVACMAAAPFVALVYACTTISSTISTS